MLSISRVRELAGVVIPVYFSPGVPAGVIRAILEKTLQDHEVFCRPERLVLVVDQGTTAESVLRQAGRSSVLKGLNRVILDEHRAKAGSICAGLRYLLEEGSSELLITRDCDGDHLQEDFSRMATLAEDIGAYTGCELVGVIGARPSLTRPMGWLRKEWERLTNRVLEDMIRYRLAHLNCLPDERFLSGYGADIQSGFRLYSRKAAEAAAQCLDDLPEDPEILTLACEFVPYLALLTQGAVFGQVQRMTMVEQPVSSYQGVDFAKTYGSLLKYVAEAYEIPAEVLAVSFDNGIVGASLYFTDSREDLLRCRKIAVPEAGPLRMAGFL